MMITQELVDAINAQIGREFGASMEYIGIASYFKLQNLNLLAKIFFEQSEEERTHAMKFVHYVIDTNGSLHIPAIPVATFSYESAEQAVEAALKWEKEVTAQINGLMSIAGRLNDYLAQGMLQWFVDEQLEEVTKMEQLLSVVRRAGEKNLIMVEAYLAHLGESG